MTYMDYVYHPEVAGRIADYINYVCPVPAAQDISEEVNDPVVGEQPARVPHARDGVARPKRTTCSRTEEDLKAWNNISSRSAQ